MNTFPYRCLPLLALALWALPASAQVLVFEDTFDSNPAGAPLDGWTESRCVTRQPDQFCRAREVVASAGDPGTPPSAPYWAQVAVVDPGGECGGSVATRVSRHFDAPVEGDYELSAWLGRAPCSSCNISATLHLDGSLVFRRTGPDLSTDPEAPELADAFYSTVLHLAAGPHMIELGMTSTKACRGTFAAYFDDVRVLRLCSDVNLDGICDEDDPCFFADLEAPELDCPAGITLGNDPGQCGAEVDYGVSATDNCDLDPLVECMPAAGFLPVGVTSVFCIATDADGNESFCTFDVTITDDEAPELDCPASISTGNDAGLCGAVVTFSADANDLCAPVEAICSPASGSLFPTGITEVCCTATDDAGNEARCYFDVTVADTTPPTIDCPPDMVVESSEGSCGTSGVAVQWSLHSDDNCSVDRQDCAPASGSLFASGETVVRCTATDSSGNSAECTFTVTVNCVAADAGCTYSHGFWKNHNRFAPGSRYRPWPVNEDTLLCGRSWLTILGTSPRGDAWVILAHQWIAAKLNVASGAGAPPEVDAALADAQTLLDGCAIGRPDRARATALAGTLDSYNNGETGPGHCD